MGNMPIPRPAGAKRKQCVATRASGWYPTPQASGVACMQAVCGKCSRVLEYSGQCPSFCAYCGQALGDSTLKTPSASDPEAATQAPLLDEKLHQAPAAVGGYRIGRELGSGG